ncbi:hypothetical protein EW146_g7583 [Bondarzewia mesenterica]|uniref:Uncharacterized protein n=1 Tax=Bondarzewia mesenterica TaxID=1095465 RepID=A0A4S4LR10_9AGAM|nr:hypothetical protein EW146_g7583 [Bondarzewia mesenterica]
METFFQEVAEEPMPMLYICLQSLASLETTDQNIFNAPDMSGTLVIIGSHALDVRELGKVTIELIAEIEKKMNGLLFHSDVFTVPNDKIIHDEPRKHASEYGFMNDLQNSWKHGPTVLEYILSSPSLSAQFAYQDQVDKVVWLPSACQKYAQKIHDLQMLLLIAMIISYGDFTQNVFHLFGLFILHSSFNKTSHAMQHNRFMIKISLSMFQQFMAFITSCNEDMFTSAQLVTSTVHDQLSHTGETDCNHYGSDEQLPLGLDRSTFISTARVSGTIHLLFGHELEPHVATPAQDPYAATATVASITEGMRIAVKQSQTSDMCFISGEPSHPACSHDTLIAYSTASDAIINIVIQTKSSAPPSESHLYPLWFLYKYTLFSHFPIADLIQGLMKAPKPTPTSSALTGDEPSSPALNASMLKCLSSDKHAGLLEFLNMDANSAHPHPHPLLAALNMTPFQDAQLPIAPPSLTSL